MICINNATFFEENSTKTLKTCEKILAYKAKIWVAIRA